MPYSECAGELRGQPGDNARAKSVPCSCAENPAGRFI
jgi:hypothetical protein